MLRYFSMSVSRPPLCPSLLFPEADPCALASGFLLSLEQGRHLLGVGFLAPSLHQGQGRSPSWWPSPTAPTLFPMPRPAAVAQLPCFRVSFSVKCAAPQLCLCAEIKVMGAVASSELISLKNRGDFSLLVPPMSCTLFNGFT